MAKKKYSKNFTEFMKSVKDVPYKIFYFTFYAGYMPLLLYLPVYFKYIGLSPVNIGILNGIRPILQCVGTPVLVMVGEKFSAKKLLLVISCIVMIAKVLIIFLFLRPNYQVCTVEYLNASRDTTDIASHQVSHKLSKRSVDKDWFQREAKAKDSFDEINNMFRRTNNKIISKKNSSATPSVTHATKNNSDNSELTLSTNSPSIPHTSTANKTATNLITKYYLVNDESEVNRIFIVLIVLAILGDCFESAVFTLVDHSCVVNMNVENYGVIRLWGNLGWGMMTPIIGVVISRFDHEFCGKILGSFHYVFFFFIGFSYIALLIGSHLDFTQTPNDVVSQEIHNIQNNFQYGMFLFASAFSGFCNGFLFTFVNWFIDSLGGSALVMGIATGCKCIVDVSLFYLLGKIIGYFGHVATLGVGFVGYIFVFLIYYAIKEAWLVVVAETIHAIVYALMTSTSVAFLIYAAPTGSSPKMQGVLQGIYWGMGTGCGSIFGGYCVQGVGFPKTFLSFTVITCIVAFIFLAMQLLSYFNRSNVEASTRSESSDEFDGDDEGDSSDTETEQIDWEAIKPPQNGYTD